MCAFSGSVNEKYAGEGRKSMFFYIFHGVIEVLSRELRKSARILALTVFMFSLVHKLGDKS
jgi:hypothetical protein